MKRLKPVLALALLSPFIAEIVFGATPFSRFASLPPLVLLYGGGAVSIRELARRTAHPWMAILCLGGAYGLIEEGLVMQTLFSPDLFSAAACGARIAGVNWVWAEALVGYHAVWSIAIPIALAELCFPARAGQPWLGRKGIAAALACYALGTLSISIVFRRLVTPTFRAPAISLIATAVVAAALVAYALSRRSAGQPAKHAETVPSPWLAGIIALTASALWMQLFALPQFLRIEPWPLLPIFLAATLAYGVYKLLRRWTGTGWTGTHRLALIAGAVVASSAYGTRVIQAESALDRTGQAVCGVVLLSGLAAIALRRAGQPPARAVSPLK